MRVTRSVLVVAALAIHLTGCGKGSGQASSLTIELPEHTQMWRWQVVKAGAPDKVVQSVTDGARTVTVPPGNYQVTLQHDQHFSGQVVWPQTIRVKRNQQATVSIQSGITLQTPENTRLWRWQVVKAGAPDDVVQWTTSDIRTLLVPPGDYQVTIHHDQHFSGRVVWPTPVHVERNQQATVSIQSGITLQTPENTRLWRWQVVKAGAPDDVVQWTTSDVRTLLVPPGDYQVTIHHDQHFSGRVVWPDRIHVTEGQTARVPLMSRVSLQAPENIRLWRWQVVKAGAPDEVVQWTTSELRTLLVPPGDYQVTIQHDQHFSGQVVWPTPVHVEKDQPAEVALHSGVKITVRSKAKIWRWQVVKAGAPDDVVQWTTSELRTLLVPPGDYQVVLQPEQYKSATVVWPPTESLVVLDGQITQAAIDLLTANTTEPSG